ncbi:pyruvate kinase [Candidatus Parcubacteria bacterium]|nr:pyruvate kinase [Candidatus Parcubacteria bacterium]
MTGKEVSSRASVTVPPVSSRANVYHLAEGSQRSDMTRTKIVCTIGPASSSASILRAMMRAGMTAARLNLSHGTYTEHRALLKTIRSVARALGLHVPVIADLQGPKIRLGTLPEEGVELKAGKRYVFSTATDTYEGKEIPVTYKQLHRDVKAGHRFLIDDGLIELKVSGVSGRHIHATVINGGLITSHKGMNFPNSRLSIGAMTDKDRQDVRFAVGAGADWIALSFVKSEQDVKDLRRLINAAGKKGQILPRIVVKIEKHEAIAAFDRILTAADGVMIARGDLGVEIPAEEVPVRQKALIEKCRLAGKPVIVATQMLDSMIRNPRPTRAEVSDVANAVFDHTSAVMLSGESASGKHPVAAVKMMASIVEEAEASPYDDVALIEYAPKDPIAAVAHSIQLASVQGSIDGVLASVELAPWSETVHRSHPEIPLFIGCPDERRARQVALRWGSVPFVIKNAREETFAKRAVGQLKKARLVKIKTRLALVLGGRHGESFDVITV